MRSAKSRLLSLALFIGGILLVSQAFAADEEPWTDRFMRKFDGINARLATLDDQQKEILAKEDKILEDLANVKIWVHRN